jgi:perosamine synthetase
MAIEFHHTHVGAQAQRLAAETLATGWISEGARVREFEAELADRLGLANPVALNSGTSALHLALVVAGVGPGDEVILPPQTFVATGLAVLMQGATPVFCDVDPRTGNLDPASFGARITDRTRAVMPVHWGGLPCDLDAIHAVADPRGIAVVEDAAHALGATYRGRAIGAISRFTCFSFQAIKHVTTGDGGALCCPGPDDHRAARTRRWFGIDRASAAPSILGERIYDIGAVGYKYHLNDLAASVGLGNLRDFPPRLARRRAIAARYLDALAGVPGLDLPPVFGDRESAWWVFTVRVDRREEFVRALAARGVPASVVHLRIDHNSCFGGLRDDLPGQAAFDERQVALPVHEGLSDDDVGTIVAAVRAGW